jgi:hypothetical protein
MDDQIEQLLDLGLEDVFFDGGFAHGKKYWGFAGTAGP